MNNPTPNEIIAKLDEELAQMKHDQPEEYLKLLKGINQRVEGILADFGKN